MIFWTPALQAPETFLFGDSPVGLGASDGQHPEDRWLSGGFKAHRKTSQRARLRGGVGGRVFPNFFTSWLPLVTAWAEAPASTYRTFNPSKIMSK